MRYSEPRWQSSFDGCYDDRGTQKRKTQIHAHRPIAASLAGRKIQGTFSGYKFVEPSAPFSDGLDETRAGLGSDRAVGIQTIRENDLSLAQRR